MRTEKALRTMYEIKLIKKRSSPEPMYLLGLAEILNELSRENGVRWYGHILKRGNNDLLRRTLDFKVAGRLRRRQLTMMWRWQLEEHTEQNGSKREGAPIKRSGLIEHELSTNMS